MRPHHSDEEIFVKKHLEQYLQSKNIDFEFDINHTDKPDLVLDIDNKRIGCELTMITVEKLMKWSNTNKKLEHDHMYSITIPYEPHMWIQKSISEKNKKIDSYVSNANLDECWLLLHCGSNSFNWFYKNEDYLLEVYRYFSSNMNQKFSKILFLYRDKEIYELIINEPESLEAPKYPIKDNVYKTITMSFFLTTLTNEDRTVNIQELPVAENIYLNFIDARLREMRNEKS